RLADVRPADDRHEGESHQKVPGSKFQVPSSIPRSGCSNLEHGTWNLELPAGEPAINDERRPGDVTAGVARQVHGRGAELVRLAKPAHRDAGLERLPERRLLAEPRAVRGGQEDPRGDGV